VSEGLNSAAIRAMARGCGFELAGIASAAPVPDYERYSEWLAAGFAGEMSYLYGHRGQLREDARSLLPAARSVICVGKLYNAPLPYSTAFALPERAWIARYAWGDDYHDTIRCGLERLDAMLRDRAPGPYESRICVDTAPLLERSYARSAGLGWIGKNTCLINQGEGSWFLLGELLTTLMLEPDTPPPGRCGSCTRCIDACPTAAIIPHGSGFALDSRRCISYFTIELRSAIPEEWRASLGANVFGCDICQDVCPWNRRAATTADPALAPREFAPRFEKLAALSEAEFRSMFRGSPVTRSKYAGFLRNVATAMGSLARPEFRKPLERLAQSEIPMVAEHARWALERLFRGLAAGVAPCSRYNTPRRQP
jgi:epoxyqueuosine reductase